MTTVVLVAVTLALCLFSICLSRYTARRTRAVTRALRAYCTVKGLTERTFTDPSLWDDPAFGVELRRAELEFERLWREVP